MHDVTGSPFSSSSIRKVLLTINVCIPFKFSFKQSFLKSDVNLVTSEKFLGYVMKCDTSEPDSTKVGNELFNSVKKLLKNYVNLCPFSSLKVMLLSIQF